MKNLDCKFNFYLNLSICFSFKLPAIASCLMKKFILDFRLFRYKVTSTALFPNTITAKSIHKTVNCSVCKRRKEIKMTIKHLSKHKD